MAKKLNVNGLKKAISTNSVAMYYADWCGYCKSMKPEYTALAEEAKKALPDVHVTRFNMDKHSAAVASQRIGQEQFGVTVSDDVRGFPTVIMYKKDGTRSLYKGPRTKEAMMSTMMAYYGAPEEARAK